MFPAFFFFTEKYWKHRIATEEKYTGIVLDIVIGTIASNYNWNASYLKSILKQTNFYLNVLNMASEIFNALLLFKERRVTMKTQSSIVFADIIFIDSATKKILVKQNADKRDASYEFVDYWRLSPFGFWNDTSSKLSLDSPLSYYTIDIGDTIGLDLFGEKPVIHVSGVEVQEALFKYSAQSSKNNTNNETTNVHGETITQVLKANHNTSSLERRVLNGKYL